jgi:transcriptional regulator with XRE-family HTH domain
MSNISVLRSKSAARMAWSGLDAEELERPGSTLLAWLLKTANARGHKLHELAAQLGVTYGYIAQLRSGQRKTIHISQQFVETCAKYLQVPSIAIKVASGQIAARDFVFPADDFERRLDSALEHIQSDPLLGSWMPARVRQLDVDVKAFLVLCYQEATGLDLIAEHRALPQIIGDLQLAAVFEEERQAAADEIKE